MPRRAQLPNNVFLYTLDQVAGLAGITETTLKRDYLFYVGRTSGARGRERMEAINIAPTDGTPVWRVPEAEYVAWLRRMGYSIDRKGNNL